MDNKRFWEKVEKTDGCWNWIGAKSKAGYGQIRADGKCQYAHRAMWEKSHLLKIPEGFYICHRCDNPGCVNPEHLFLGTPKDNRQDSVRKGRSNKGERNGRSRLQKTDVLEIRRLHSEGVPHEEIASKFKIVVNTVYYIVSRRLWKHLP